MEFKEILKLEEMLREKKIPHYLVPLRDGYQIIFPSLKMRLSDVIECTGSYGAERDTLEMMGLLSKEEMEQAGDCAIGGFTAEEVCARWEEKWKEISKEGV